MISRGRGFKSVVVWAAIVKFPSGALPLPPLVVVDSFVILNLIISVMKIRPPLARILGYLMGDGSVRKQRPRRIPRKDHYETDESKLGFNYLIEFYNKTPELLSAFSKDFNDVFKRITGTTPSTYARQVKKGSEKKHSDV